MVKVSPLGQEIYKFANFAHCDFYIYIYTIETQIEFVYKYVYLHRID